MFCLQPIYKISVLAPKPIPQNYSLFLLKPISQIGPKPIFPQTLISLSVKQLYFLYNLSSLSLLLSLHTNLFSSHLPRRSPFFNKSHLVYLYASRSLFTTLLFVHFFLVNHLNVYGSFHRNLWPSLTLDPRLESPLWVMF